MLKKILVHKSDSTIIQLIRYTFVGAFAFIIDYSLLYLLTEYAEIYYLYSAGISFLCGLIVNYVLSIIWVFQVRRFHSRLLEFAFFGVIGIIGLALNELIIWFFTEYILFHYMISKLFSTALVYLWNFFARKYLLYSVGGKRSG